MTVPFDFRNHSAQIRKKPMVNIPSATVGTGGQFKLSTHGQSKQLVTLVTNSKQIA
jgi:hypothetical protein